MNARPKVGVRPLSREAFATVDVTAGQEAVFTTIEMLIADGIKPTDQAIGLRLGWTINKVTPRRGELVEKQLIYRAGKVRGLSGRFMAWWKPTRSRAQLEMFGGKEIDYG